MRLIFFERNLISRVYPFDVISVLWLGDSAAALVAADSIALRLAIEVDTEFFGGKLDYAFEMAVKNGCSYGDGDDDFILDNNDLNSISSRDNDFIKEPRGVECGASEFCFFSLVLRHARTPATMARSKQLLELGLAGEFAPMVGITTDSGRQLCMRFIDETDDLIKTIRVENYIK